MRQYGTVGDEVLNTDGSVFAVLMRPLEHRLPIFVSHFKLTVGEFKVGDPVPMIIHKYLKSVGCRLTGILG